MRKEHPHLGNVRRVITGLMLVAILGACGTPPEQARAAEAQQRPGPYALGDGSRLLTDELGDYFVVAARMAGGDDVDVRVEERHYPATWQSRFVVEQANLRHRIDALGVSHASLSIYRGETGTPEAIGERNLSSVVTAAALPSTLAETDLYDVDITQTGHGSRVCALFELTYATEGISPLTLNTCDPRLVAAVRGN